MSSSPAFRRRYFFIKVKGHFFAYIYSITGVSIYFIVLKVKRNFLEFIRGEGFSLCMLYNIYIIHENMGKSRTL